MVVFDPGENMDLIVCKALRRKQNPGVPFLRAIRPLRPGSAPPYQTSHTVACPPQIIRTRMSSQSPPLRTSPARRDRSRNPDLKRKQLRQKQTPWRSRPGSKNKKNPRIERRRAIRPWRDNDNNGRRKAARNENENDLFDWSHIPRLGLPRDSL